jgi:hypothetical protein
MSNSAEHSDRPWFSYRETYWQAFFTYQQNIERIRDRGATKQQQYLQGSIDFGRILIQSILLLNAGGLVAIPAYFMADRQIYDVFFDTAAQCVVLFCLGIFFVVSSSFATYLNYARWVHFAKQEEELQELYEGNRSAQNFVHIYNMYFPLEQIQNKNDRDVAINKLNEEASRTTIFINWTRYFAIGFGVASLFCFLAGVYVTAKAIISA